MRKPRYRPAAWEPQRISGRREFRCDNCDNKPDCPMLHDHVWETVAGKRALLCVSCTEAKLGRKITIDDLKDCVGNAFTFLIYDQLVEKVDLIKKDIPLNFVECDTCKAKPGTPALCKGCLNNRFILENIRRICTAV